MEPQAQKLKAVIADLNRLYQALHDVMRSERSHLIAAETDKLQQTNKTKELLLLKLRAVEKQRIVVAGEFAVNLGLPRENPRLLQIAEKLEQQKNSELANYFREQHKILSLHVHNATEQNQENETYAKSALRLLDGAVQEIKQTVTTKSTYGKQGQMAGGSETQSGNFVRKEA